MINLNLENEIQEWAQQALEPDFRIFSMNLVPGKNILKIKISLDKLSDPWGAPNVSDCSRYTRAFDNILEEKANAGKLTNEYVIEVSSPGAERTLAGEAEWARFQDKPMKVRYYIAPEKRNTEVFLYVKTDGDRTFWKKAKLKKDKKVAPKRNIEEVIILTKDIIQVNLYLDI